MYSFQYDFSVGTPGINYGDSPNLFIYARGIFGGILRCLHKLARTCTGSSLFTLNKDGIGSSGSDFLADTQTIGNRLNFNGLPWRCCGTYMGLDWRPMFTVMPIRMSASRIDDTGWYRHSNIQTFLSSAKCKVLYVSYARRQKKCAS